jgi:hypothetical protein
MLDPKTGLPRNGRCKLHGQPVNGAADDGGEATNCRGSKEALAKICSRAGDCRRLGSSDCFR